MARHVTTAIAVAALLALPAPAGEIRFFQWPVAPVPQEISVIPVFLDISYYVLIQNQEDLRIKLKQVTIRDYEGCTDMMVISNFNLTLSCSITSTNKVPGDYSCSINPAYLDAPGGTTEVCAKLTDANLTLVPGGLTDLHVATVTVKVAPRF